MGKNSLRSIFFSLLGSFVGGLFGRFLGSEGRDLMTNPFFLLLIFVILVSLIFLYRKRLSTTRKKSLILMCFIYSLLGFLGSLYRVFIIEHICAVLGITTAAFYSIFCVSSDSGNSSGEMSPPLLESSSSSESLNTYRNVIAAENEAEIYERIRSLENKHYYNLPPQNNIGDYERLVRERFDQAVNVTHYREIYDQEYFELRVLERKGLLEDRLQNLMLGEQKLDRIMELSPYTNIRKEAYEFIKYKVEPVADLRHAYQRYIMDGSLNSFLNDLNQHGRQSEIYREFYQYYTDSDFRRLHGLPLP